jgi:2-polyprenyl-6-methoxyphenol hydroxylase-like FAD-dependent oxidoreductase
MLLKQLGRIGIEVEYSRRVVEYYEDVSSNEGGVVLDDGLRIQADLVVAADGLGTKSGMLISGRNVEARSSGYAIFRTAFPVERALVDSEVAQRFKMLENGRSVNEVCTSTSVPKLLLLNKVLRR